LQKVGAAALAMGLAILGVQALSAAPAAAVTLPPGSVKRVNTLSPFDVRTAKSFSANCSAGQRVLGGGAFTVGGVHAVITEMQPIHPNTGVDSFEVSAAADQFGIAGPWGFQVFAFCATVPSAMELEIVSHSDPPTSNTFDDASLRCPNGKILVGGGGKIDNGGGQVDLGTGPAGVTTIGAFAKEDADGYAGTYTDTVYGVCASQSIINDYSAVHTSSGTSAPNLTETLACPTGMELTGITAETGLPGTHLQQIRPTQANLAIFGTQSSVPPRGVWGLDYAVFCMK
jgi:hypothetical protein